MHSGYLKRAETRRLRSIRFDCMPPPDDEIRLNESFRTTFEPSCHVDVSHNSPSESVDVL